MLVIVLLLLLHFKVKCGGVGGRWVMDAVIAVFVVEERREWWWCW